MFEDAYRKEMSDVRASESLIADTLKNMQAEQLKMQAEQAKPAPRTKRPLLFLVGLPAAACLILAFFGVTLYTQATGYFEQGSQQHFVFQPVEGNTSLMGDALFGSLEDLIISASTDLKRVECDISLLPAGILDAPPVIFGERFVYLGYDEQQATYYAAFLKGPSRVTWVLLWSAKSSEAEFIEAIETFLAQQ
ncbi:MAG: hypothetical protein FWE41_04925 [Coriobacteriia bacterium]|nr:hypothetical protein [Coriobacteriia bacterium]MCL2750656.1 hypothetical protein [Coriobacteriia bacterium]